VNTDRPVNLVKGFADTGREENAGNGPMAKGSRLEYGRTLKTALSARSLTDTIAVMEIPIFEKLAEVDLDRANQMLKKGWIFVRCYVMLVKLDAEHWTEKPCYVIGKPERDLSIADSPINE